MTPHHHYDSLQSAVNHARTRCIESCKAMALVQSGHLVRVVEARLTGLKPILMTVKAYNPEKSRMTFEEACLLAKERSKKYRMPVGVRKIDGTPMWNTFYVTDKNRDQAIKIVDGK